MLKKYPEIFFFLFLLFGAKSPSGINIKEHQNKLDVEVKSVLGEDKADKTSHVTCVMKNAAFMPNESVTLKVYYSAAGAYIGAGEAVFTTSIEKFNGRQVYHCVGEGKTYSFFDNFFKVRDRYESFIDTSTLLPYKFIRNVDEGGHVIYNNVTFNRTAGTAVSTNGVFKVTNCIQDVVSAVYHLRNINFSMYKVNDKIPVDMFLDDEIFNLYMRYMGKEK